MHLYTYLGHTVCVLWSPDRIPISSSQLCVLASSHYAQESNQSAVKREWHKILPLFFELNVFGLKFYLDSEKDS